MPLDNQIAKFLDDMKAANVPSFSDMTPTECRAVFAQFLGTMPKSDAPIAGTRDLSIPGPAGAIPARLYTPKGIGNFPILVFFHGGGWVIGDLESHDAVCRELCAGVGCVVLAVDYRLAPEHKFPAAPDDCLAATRWAATHAREIGGDATRIAVGGDSAGGNLAAVTAQRIRDEGGPSLAGQLLIYPVTDHYSASFTSMTENAEGYFLSRADMVWFEDHYLRSKADIQNPSAAPLRAASLDGLPPALVVTAEFDPLRDEGEAYGRALEKAGVPTQMTRYDGAIHGFITLYQVMELGRKGLGENIAWLKQRFDA